jgi:hypothetical protein
MGIMQISLTHKNVENDCLLFTITHCNYYFYKKLTIEATNLLVSRHDKGWRIVRITSITPTSLLVKFRSFEHLFKLSYLTKKLHQV